MGSLLSSPSAIWAKRIIVSGQEILQIPNLFLENTQAYVFYFIMPLECLLWIASPPTAFPFPSPFPLHLAPPTSFLPFPSIPVFFPPRSTLSSSFIAQLPPFCRTCGKKAQNLRTVCWGTSLSFMCWSLGGAGWATCPVCSPWAPGIEMFRP